MTYILERPQEGMRIERKTDRALTLAQLRWAGIAEGMHVLDLGCAAGTTCRLMAELVGASGRIVGVDASACRIQEGKEHAHGSSTIQYRQGDACDFPAMSGEFDLSWSRFLFEYLPEPAAALREMIRVTRDGGCVAVSDLDGNCIWHDPCNPALRREIDEALHTLRYGFNPRVGMSLFSMFVDAGLRDIDVDVRPYHLIAGKIDPQMALLWHMKLDGVSHALVSRGWAPARANALSRMMMEHLQNPRTITYSVLFSVRGRVLR